MYQIDNDTAVNSMPTPAAPGVNVNGFFSNGNPSLGEPPTIVDTDYMNALMMEICNVITGSGLTLSKTNQSQLLQAIELISQKDLAIFAASTTAANTYTATLSPAPSAYTDGMICLIQFTHANTTSNPTINLNGLGGITITHTDGTGLAAADIPASGLVLLGYNGTNFQMLSSPISVTKIQYSSYNSASDTGTANIYAAALTPAITSLQNGINCIIKIANTNTSTSCTFSINGLTATTILLGNGSAPAVGDMPAGMEAQLYYNGTSWILLNPFSSAQIQQSAYTYAADTGTANAYACALTPAPAAYSAGLRFSIKIANANTTSSTINVSGLGNKNIKLTTGGSLVGGEMPAGMIAEFFYDGTTNVQLLNPAYITALGSLNITEGRLTLTTGTPVTTSDVLAATTVYFSPYKGNKIALYDGTAFWNLFSFAETSFSVPATTSQMYDVFGYNNGGTFALQTVAWTNDTTRATALVLQNGVLVKSGDTAKRYLGSFRTTTVSGQTEDSAKKRYVWNYYNRIKRVMSVVEAASSWTYSTATWRQANANTSDQLDLIIGWSEDIVNANIVSAFDSSAELNAFVGIGLDSTTVNSSIVNAYSTAATANGASGYLSANYSSAIAVGRHVLTWLEKGAGSGTQVFLGTGGLTSQSGIYGDLMG